MRFKNLVNEEDVTDILRVQNYKFDRLEVSMNGRYVTLWSGGRSHRFRLRRRRWSYVIGNRTWYGRFKRQRPDKVNQILQVSTPGA